MEAAAEIEQGSEKEGLRLSGVDLRPPRSVEGSRRSHGDKEAFLPETRGEEMEMR